MLKIQEFRGLCGSFPGSRVCVPGLGPHPPSQFPAAPDPTFLINEGDFASGTWLLPLHPLEAERSLHSSGMWPADPICTPKKEGSGPSFFSLLVLGARCMHSGSRSECRQASGGSLSLAPTKPEVGAIYR